MLAILPIEVHRQPSPHGPSASIGDENARFALPPQPVGRAAMIDLKERIEYLEKRAAESARVASLSADPEARLYHASLARELRDIAVNLRSQYA
jgi:hypothetical protein